MKKDESDYWFNEGRQTADNKWLKEIDNRIAELEKSVGIPELRQLKKKRYTWDLKEERKKFVRIIPKHKQK